MVKMYLKKGIRILRFFFVLGTLSIIGINIYINTMVKSNLYELNSYVPKNTYGLILGTSKFVMGGGKNVYYQQRIKAAYYLYKKNKVDSLIVSGDNRDPHYDEPARMKASLIHLGVPENIIIKDKKGIHTQQSIHNFKNNYPNRAITIITQKPHNQRALYYAEKYKVDAIGVNASNTSILKDPKLYFREFFAKIKAFFI